MARIIGTTFQGVAVYDVDPEAPAKRSTLRKIAEDEALIRDMITGDNTPALTLNHTGDAVAGQAGALLGVPCTQLHVPDDGDHGIASGGTVGEDTRFAFFPWYKPPGETEVLLAFHGSPGFGYEAQVRSSSDTIVESASFTENDDNGVPSYFARVTGLSADPNTGSDQLYFIAIRGAVTNTARTFYGVRVLYRLGGPAQMTLATGYNQGDAITVPATTVSAAEVADFTDVGSSFFGDNDEDYAGPATAATTLEDYGHGVDGYLLTTISENQNAAFERATGAPAGGNEAYTLEDSGDVNPTQGAFLDGSTAGKANEAEFGMPLAIVTHGSIAADGLANDGKQTRRAAPGLTSLTKALNCQIPFMAPDFPTGASSRLRVCALVVTSDENPGFVSTTLNWEPEIRSSAGLVDSQAVAESTFTRIGSTPFYFVEWTAVDFTPDVENILLDYWDASLLKDTDGGAFRVLGHAIVMDTP